MPTRLNEETYAWVLKKENHPLSRDSEHGCFWDWQVNGRFAVAHPMRETRRPSVAAFARLRRHGGSGPGTPRRSRNFAKASWQHKPYLEHFRIAAGLSDGSYRGAQFNDGDFYKWMEYEIY